MMEMKKGTALTVPSKKGISTQVYAGGDSTSSLKSLAITKPVVRGKGTHLDFNVEVKKYWMVKRDECGDEYIALTGKNGLGYGGMDHVYLISTQKVGCWLTSRQIRQKIQALKRKLPGLVIEQLGDGEAVVSAPVQNLDELCRAARARKRRQLSENQKRHLMRISPFLRKKSPIKTGSNGSKIVNPKAKRDSYGKCPG